MAKYFTKRSYENLFRLFDLHRKMSAEIDVMALRSDSHVVFIRNRAKKICCHIMSKEKCFSSGQIYNYFSFTFSFRDVLQQLLKRRSNEL